MRAPPKIRLRAQVISFARAHILHIKAHGEWLSLINFEQDIAHQSHAHSCTCMYGCIEFMCICVYTHTHNQHTQQYTYAHTHIYIPHAHTHAQNGTLRGGERERGRERVIHVDRERRGRERVIHVDRERRGELESVQNTFNVLRINDVVYIPGLG